MEQIGIRSADIPVIARTQVLVVGSGPAGVSAAVAAAGNGADTLLAEKYGFLGGALSASMVQSYGFSVNQNPHALSGIALQIDQRVRAFGAAQPDYRGYGVLIDPEMYKCLLDAWMEEAGVRVLLHACACDVCLENERLAGVVFQSKSGFGLVRADCVVDATGDGDIAAFAGAEYEKREPEALQPVTVVFGISGVDTHAFQHHIDCHPNPEDADYGLRRPFRLARNAGEWNVERTGGAWKSVTAQGDITSLNILMTRAVDPTSVFDLTRGEIEGRKQVVQAIRVMRKYGTDIGLGNCFLRSIAPQLGLRESRRIVGDYQLCEEDVLAGRDFSDGIGKILCFIDSFGKIHRPEHGQMFSLPYRILLPGQIDGLLTAGRCVSCDEKSYGAVRMMVCCAVTGEAAGTAAAMSALTGISPRILDVSILRRRLEQNGVKL